jgi:hypothetical protein
MNLTNLLLLTLGTWRISNLVANEHGPFWMFAHIRRLARKACKCNRFCRRLHLFELIECEYCNSIWIGATITILYLIFGHIIVWGCVVLALSALTIFLKRLHEFIEATGKTILAVSFKVNKSS